MLSKQALYIDKSNQIHADEVSLCLMQLHGQRRIPLRRISYIVCHTSVNWTGVAMSACHQHGISIHWLDTKGKVIASTYPQRPSQGVGGAMACFFGQALAMNHYHRWLRACRSHSFYQIIKDVPDEWTKDERQIMLSSYLNRYHIVYTLPELMQFQLAIWCASVLNQYDVEPFYDGRDGETLCLEVSLQNDLVALFWDQLNVVHGGLVVTNDHHTIIGLFEKQKKLLSEQLHHYLHDLICIARRSLQGRLL